MVCGKLCTLYGILLLSYVRMCYYRGNEPDIPQVVSLCINIGGMWFCRDRAFVGQIVRPRASRVSSRGLNV